MANHKNIKMKKNKYKKPHSKLQIEQHKLNKNRMISGAP